MQVKIIESFSDGVITIEITHNEETITLERDGAIHRLPRKFNPLVTNVKQGDILSFEPVSPRRR